MHYWQQFGENPPEHKMKTERMHGQIMDERMDSRQ